jgi:hypothetical protein
MDNHSWWTTWADGPPELMDHLSWCPPSTWGPCCRLCECGRSCWWSWTWSGRGETITIAWVRQLSIWTTNENTHKKLVIMVRDNVTLIFTDSTQDNPSHDIRCPLVMSNSGFIKFPLLSPPKLHCPLPQTKPSSFFEIKFWSIWKDRTWYCSTAFKKLSHPIRSAWKWNSIKLQ